MAKNKVQFQKGLSIGEFMQQYGTEEKCRAALIRLRWPLGFRCPRCGHHGFCEIQSRKLYQCNYCHSQTSITSGTIFAATKLPLSIWFLAIYLITKAKNGVSSLSLARSLNISQKAALRLKHKLQQTMKERDDTKPLSGIVLLDDAYWGGKKRDGKRGRGATGKLPFVAALRITKSNQPVTMKMSTVSGFTRKELSAWSVKNLGSKSIVASDGLQCFSATKDAKCRHEPIVTHGDAGYDEYAVFPWLNTMIGNVKNAIRGTYHAVSQKHFPRYLAEFCYRFNRRYKLEALIERLVYVAARTPPMPYRLLTMAEARG